MRILDTFCKGGGCGMGYHLAGFEVVGVDIEQQKHFPFEFHQGDAVEFIKAHGHEFDAIHASPPCQRFSKAQRIQKREHPDLVTPTREVLENLGLPYIIENVPPESSAGAALVDPVELCGCMFPELNVYRERHFEFGNWPGIGQPEHAPHTEPLVKMGRPPKPGHRMHVVGNFSGVREAREAMGIDWMTRDELREAIPPAYTRHIGRALAAHLKAVAA